MDIYTKKDAERCFERLAKVMGKQAGNCWERKNNKNIAKIGCWDLDYNPTYGGCIIEEMVTEGGGVTHPFGEGRLKPFEFCRATNMIEKAIEIKGKR